MEMMCYFRLPFRIFPVCLCFYLTGVLSARTRFHEYTEQFHRPPDVAQPIAASYVGGGGNEYIAGAAFLPDGALILAGNSLGPRFEPRGAQVRVLGRDTAAAPAVPVNRNDRGNVQSIRSWEVQEGAGFLLQLSPDYQRIVRAVRLPWNSGVVTDVAVDGQGAVYVTGRVGPNFASAGNSRRVEVEGFESNGESFFARLNPDWSGFAWCHRVSDDRQSAPMLRYLGEGVVSWVGENAFHFDANGRVLRSRPIGFSRAWVRGVDFRTFDYATGGMRHTRTGYEPWIQPALHMYNADGTYRFRTHEWDPTLAGTNWSRLISDSATHVIAFDRNGKLLVGGWSDGGNSVWAHVPFDLSRHMQEAIRERTGRATGLPFSTWGAGIGSFAHLLRLDPADANPMSYTLFISYLWNENKPNSVTMHMMDTAVDNSLLISGGSAWGLIQTGSVVVNTLDAEARDYIGGDFIAVLNEDWNNIRYSSAVPGAGRVILKRRNNRMGTNFGADSVSLGNRTRVVFFGSAQQDDKFKPVSPLMPFSGGDIDGLFVVLEMDRLAPVEFPLPPFPTAGRRSVGTGEGDQGLSGRFMVNRGMRNDHSVIALRDSTGRQWPTFYRGRPVGESTIEAQGRGTFTLIGESNRVQLRGGTLNPMRVGGSEDRDDFPEITLQIELRDATRSNVTIEYQGRTVQKQGQHSIRNARPTARGSLDLRGVVTATRGELGLAPPNSPEAREDIVIEWWAPARPAGGNAPAPARGQRNQPAPAPARTAAAPAATTPPPAAPSAPSAPAVDRNAMRTWTDTQGRSIEARMIRTQGDQVTIQRSDGQEFTIPIHTLSPADRNFLR